MLSTHAPSSTAATTRAGFAEAAPVQDSRGSG
jgi:hypothetical protein